MGGVEEINETKSQLFEKNKTGKTLNQTVEEKTRDTHYQYYQYLELEINHHYSSSQVKPPSMLLQPSTHYDNCTYFISHD